MPNLPHVPHLVLKLLKLGRIPDPKIWESVGNHLASCSDCSRFYESLPELSDRRPSAIPVTDPSPTSDLSASLSAWEHPDWILLGKLGEGGSGGVYLARHRWLRDELRALKIIPTLSNEEGEAFQRAIREGVIRRIPLHENLLKVFHVDPSPKNLLIEMEFIPGQDLEQLASLHPDQKIPYQEACGYIVQALNGVDHAERHGLLHRDLKPSNLMLGLDGTIKILDFGLAKLQLDGLDITQTQEGVRGAGSAEYLSPEQADDLRSADLRSELYSLGCTLYRLIAGHPPYGPHSGHQGRNALLKAHKTGQYVPLSVSTPEVPQGLSAAIDRLLKPQASDRFENPREVAQALWPFVSDEGRLKSIGWLGPLIEPQPPRKPVSSLAVQYASGVLSWFLPTAVNHSLIALLILVSVFPVVIFLRTGGQSEEPKSSSRVPLDATGLATKPAPLSSPDPSIPEIHRGKWSIEHRELVQTSLLGGWGRQPLLTFGDPHWENYDLTLDFQKTSEGSIIFCFHCTGENERCWYSPSCYDQGRGSELAQFHQGKWERADGNFVWQTDPPEVGKWYSVKLEIRGANSRCYLGDHLQFEFEDPRFVRGRIGLGTWTTQCKFRNIRVTDPAGKVLWSGFPHLPPAPSILEPEQPDPFLADPHPMMAETPFDAAQALQHQLRWAEHLQRPIEIRNTVGMKLRLIPPGTFLIGSPLDERDRLDDEVQSKRILTRPFYLGKTEVTQREWFSVMQTTPWKGKTSIKEGDDFPASHVSSRDAEDFLKRLNELEIGSDHRQGGWTYALPTEAQWEYACRGGTQARFSFGEDDSRLGDFAWYGGMHGNGNAQPEPYAHQVQTKLPNPFGLYDMHGNLGEWCQDLYAADYYENSPQSNPTGPTSGLDRVLRGGSWYYFGHYCRSAQRNGFNPFHRSYDLGFRVALIFEPDNKSNSE